MKLNAKQASPEDSNSFSKLFTARYAGATACPPDKHLPILETLLARRSVRAYLPDPVPDADVSCAIAAAQSAASSSNLQAWSVITVREPERKARLSKLANDQKHIRSAPLLLVWLADLCRLRQIAGKAERPSEALDYLEMFVTGVIDATLAAQNAAVAFEAMGYGTCYIGSIRSYPAEVGAELALPPEGFPIFGMTVGREDPEARAGVKPRLPQHAVCFSEQYGGNEPHQDVSRYDAVMRMFQKGQSMPIVDWSVKSTQRVAGPSSLKNRDKLKTYLEQMGFGLK